MMMDDNVVAVSPATVYRILKKNNLLMPWNPKASSKGTGFKQPTGPHKHWHTDISYINIDGTFYYLSTILDGYSRYIVHWEIRKQMTEQDVVIVDVRTPAEVTQGAIKGAINIDVNSPGFIQKISELDKTKTYLVYCRSGARSARACNSLAGVGFTKLFNLQGGYLAWAASK